jgi:pimeloyl-ACP methyl ester carboxylesterase
MKILLWTLIGLGIFILLIIIYLGIIIFTPVLSATKEAFSEDINQANLNRPSPENRESISIKVGNDIVKAWLYLPQNHQLPVPCVILNNGFGGTKDGMLEQFALRYAQAGMASINYDYRYFGESSGEPRQYYNKAAQLEDMKAVIAYARSRKEIDSKKIALFGTSAGGGYGLIEAASDKNISAVICQCPALDEEADKKHALKSLGIGHMLKLLIHALRDKGRSRFGLSPHSIPIVGPPGSFAVLTAPGAFDGYARVIAASPPFKPFQNRVCARFMVEKQGFNPIDYADKVDCPVHFAICEFDNLVSPDSYKRVAEILGEKADIHVYLIGHFDIYLGEDFEKAVTNQIKFLKKSFRY